MSDLIDRGAAIDIVMHYGKKIPTYAIACKAGLEKLPSAQPKRTEERTETHACDLISRQAAINALERKKDKNAKGDIGGFYNKIIQNDIDALMQLPSAKPDVSDINVANIISLLSDIRSQYNCFDPKEEPYYKVLSEMIEALSVNPDTPYKQGKWDMFELITSAWYGKQYYFKEDGGMAYSRKSHKTMTADDAVLEFLGEITE